MSIDQKNGRYRARWRDATGASRLKTFDRKADARAFLATVEADLQRGTYLPPQAGAQLVRSFADEWLAGAMNLGQGGLDTYRRDLDRHILPALGDLPLRRLTTATIDQYLRAQLDRGLAPSTVHRHYRTIRRMCQVAVDRQKIPRNPCDPITPPKVEHGEMRFLTVDQIEALATAISPRYRAWVLVAAYGGIRWSEGVGLRRADIAHDRITVTGQLIRRADGEWHRDAPKTRAGRRTVTLPTSIADELAAHLDEYTGPDPGALVFANAGGRPMNGPSFRSNIWVRALDAAKIPPGVRVHDLRHTAVALAVAVGAHPKAIQARMGHASIQITLDRYGHLFPEMDGQIAADLDRLRAG